MTRTMRYGIDVSEWQKEIDWPKAAASGVEFAMIRATHGQKQDACFERNIRGALAAGVDVGVYCCSYAADAAEVRAEAALFLQTILPFREEITYPAAFDAEQPRQFALGKERVTQLMLTFCEAVTAAGYIPLVYTNCNWLNSVVDKPALADAGLDLWVAWPRPADGTEHQQRRSNSKGHCRYVQQRRRQAVEQPAQERERRLHADPDEGCGGVCPRH